MEELKADVSMWKSCCFEVDKNAVLFFSQLIISILVMLFCIAKLVTGASAEDKPYLQSTLTFLCGAWLPQPKLK